MKCDLGFNYDKAMKRQNHSQNEINELRNKLNSLDNIAKSLTNKQLLCFLDSCESVAEAAKVIQAYFETKKSCLEMFANRDPTSPAIQQCLQNQNYFYLPVTPDNYSVIYHRISSTKASNYIHDQACKTFFMTLDSCIYAQGPRSGLIILFDMKNIGLSHITRPKIQYWKIFFRYLQDALPAKLKEIHILNAVSFFDVLLAMVKPFMKADIFNKLHLHHSSMDYEKFHNEVLPKSCLPSDYGGDLESVEKLHENHCKEFLTLREFFLATDKQVGFKST
ncbi:unnamed protein product [Diamesa tonsa]